jgi:hypothetical protein
MNKPHLVNYLNHLLSASGYVLNRDAIIKKIENKKIEVGKFNLGTKKLILEIDNFEKIIIGLPIEGIIITECQLYVIDYPRIPKSIVLSYPLSQFSELEIISKTMWSRGLIKMNGKTISIISKNNELIHQELKKCISQYFSDLSAYDEYLIFQEQEDLKNEKEDKINRENIFIDERENFILLKRKEIEEKRILEEEREEERVNKAIRIKEEIDACEKKALLEHHDRMIKNPIYITDGAIAYKYSFPESKTLCSFESIDFIQTNGSRVFESEIIVKIINRDKLSSTSICSPKNGYIEFLYRNSEEFAFIIFDSSDLRHQCLFTNLTKLTKDEFTEEERIYFDYVAKPIKEITDLFKEAGPFFLDNKFLDQRNKKEFLASNKNIGFSSKNYGLPISNDVLSFSFENINGQDNFIIYYHAKDYKIKEGDSIIFLHNDASKSTFIIKGKPIAHHGDTKCIKIPLYFEDLELFKLKEISKIRVNLNEDSSFIDYEKGTGFQLKIDFQYAFNKMACDYHEKVIKDVLNYTPVSLELGLNENIINNKQNCFVYLMIDTTNNAYKIGISNKPKYREKTLQSEKPTIELICHKDFPVRKIAEGIEKGLHKAYADKKIRGEWFRLSEEDVKHIIQTLS